MIIIIHNSFQVDDLKKELQKRGLRTKGTKAELQERLLDSLKNGITISRMVSLSINVFSFR